MSVQQAAMFDVQEAPQVPTLTLLRAYYNNFKGLGEVMLDTGGGNISVFGKNASGKTRLEDGILWLLFGKDSANRDKFVVKPLDEFNQAIHHEDVTVEAVFSWKNRAVTLKRLFKEVWTQKKGSVDKTLTSHTTEFWVDGVSKTEAQYKAFIASIVDEKVFRLLTDPRYFNEQLHWEERRRILLEVCGDVADEDVIASDPKLHDLLSILGNRRVDDHRKVLKEEKTKTAKAMNQIPVQVAEVEKGIAGVAGMTAEQIAQDLRQARTERQEKAEELLRAENGGAITQKQNRISEIRSKLLDLESGAREKADAVTRQKKGALSDAQEKVGQVERDLRGVAGDLAEAERQLPRLTQQKKDLVAQWEAVDAEEFVHSGEAVCPTCGQDLPEEMVQEAREKALGSFNLSKASRLEANEAEGAEVHGQIAAVETEVKRCKDASTTLKASLPALQKQVSALQGEVEKMKAQAQNRDGVSTTPEYVKLATERDTLQKQIEDLKAGSQVATMPLRADLMAMDANIAALEKKVAQVDQAEGARKRIAELQAEEKRLAAEYERLAHESDLADEFVKTKVRMLEGKINDRFTFATFKMFNELMKVGEDGAKAVEECCETLYQGVPYSTNLNTGARMNIGLDLINVFSERYGFRAPVFIDNAESITSFIPVSTQVIKLIANLEDIVLRIEREVKK